MKETITWIIDGSLPDSDTTVLVQERTEQVGEGFHDGTHWRWASSALIRAKVTAWAHLPSGPAIQR
jgi:hypothetical protein